MSKPRFPCVTLVTETREQITCYFFCEILIGLPATLLMVDESLFYGAYVHFNQLQRH